MLAATLALRIGSFVSSSVFSIDRVLARGWRLAVGGGGRLAVGGWWLVGGCRLAVGGLVVGGWWLVGGFRLAVGGLVVGGWGLGVGSWQRMVVGGGWRLASGGWWSLGAVLKGRP